MKPHTRTALSSLFGLVLALSVCSVLPDGASARGVNPAVKIRVQPRIVRFRQPRPESVTRIAGELLDRRPGVRVVLEARRWPFSGDFQPVGKTRTGRGGAFAFVRRPSLAIRYRVLVPQLGLLSRSRAVYVTAGLTSPHCSISGHGRRGGCEDFNASAGVYTLQISYKLLYPKSVTAIEGAKPALFYYGQRDGTRRYPRVMKLQAAAYPQFPLGAGSTRLFIEYPITLPGTDWSMYWTACTQTSERSDGFGMPGLPGSSGCGAPTTTVHRFVVGPPLG